MRDNQDVEEFLNEGQDREDIPAKDIDYDTADEMRAQVRLQEAEEVRG